MATISTINSGDQISDSRAVINTNFTNLNNDKIETSVIDTDTALAANSDSKIATQKAVKAYADTLLGSFTSSRSGVGSPPASSSTQTITHSLGRTPIVIRISARGSFTSSTNSRTVSISDGTYNVSGNRCLYVTGDTGNHDPATSTTFAVYADIDDTTVTGSGIIQNVTSTTFDIVWTTTGDLSRAKYHWEAN